MVLADFDHSGEEQGKRATAPREAPELREGLLRLARIVHSEEPVGALLTRFARLIVESLDADYVEILEHLPGRSSFACHAQAGKLRVHQEANNVPQNLESQAGYTCLRNKPVVVTDAGNEDRFDQWRGLAAVGIQSGVTVPVPPESSRFGVLGVYCRRPRAYSVEEVSFLVDASRYLAGVLVRYCETRHRRAAEQRLRMVEEAAIRAASALDEHIALQSFARLFSGSRDGLADVCFIDLEQETEIHRAAAAADGAPVRAFDPHGTSLRYPLEPDCRHGVPAVLYSGQPDIITGITDEHLQSLARDDEHLRALEELNPISCMSVPIKIRRHILGGLILFSRTRSYNDHDARHAARLASIVGLAISGTRARPVARGDVRDHVEHCFPVSGPETPKPVARPGTTQGVTDSDDGAGSTSETSVEAVPIPGRMGSVLSLLIADVDVVEIAKIMGTTQSAVYKQDHRLRQRFGVKTRKELIARARQLGYGASR